MSKDEFWSGLWGIIFTIYFIVAGIHMIYFEWVYWNTHGPMAGFLFGTVVASFKSMIWPLWYLI